MLKRKNKNAAPPRPRLLATAALAVMLGVGGLAAVQPALADEGGNTTDVTIQVSNEDGNIAWSAPTVVPMKATAAGTLIGPNADALSIRNLSAFPIRVKTMDAQAADPFHLVADVDKSSGDNDFQMSVNGVAAAPAVELADDGTWAMGYAGNADGTDVLPLTLSGAKITRVTEDLSTAKKAATVTWTVEPTTTIKPEPKPDPENGTAFAVYSADDQSLDFYKRDCKPEVGDTFNSKTVTKLFDIDETKGDSVYGVVNSFQDNADSSYSPMKAEVVDSGLKPMSTSQWFYYFTELTDANLIKLDTSNVVDMDSMFYTCWQNLTQLDLSTWDTSKVRNMSSLFGCDMHTTMALESITGISDWNTANVEDMSGMFSYCSKLKHLDLSGWDTSSVCDMTEMFRDCSSLSTVGGISSWNTSKVGSYNAKNHNENGSVSRMFYGCSSLTADCSDWDVSNVSEHDEFSDNATGVIAPNWVS